MTQDAPQFFGIRNWKKFQHYSKRNPPWIRLYTSLLRERAYQSLSDTGRSHLIGLFLLASQHDNRIPADMAWLRHELCTKQPIDLKTLAASGWIEYEEQDASKMLAETKMLAPCKQDATPETETDNSEQRQRQTAFGRFENVLLTESQKVNLETTFGIEGALQRIEALSEGIASKGYRYKSHYATILSWERKNAPKGNGNGHGSGEDTVQRAAREAHQRISESDEFQSRQRQAEALRRTLERSRGATS